jgi:hypothetical protein
VSDIVEQFGYNGYLPIIYRDCKWIPYHMLDYDFCWNVIDVPSGRVLQVDSECNTLSDLGYTFEGHMHNFKTFLEGRKKNNESGKDGEAGAAAAAAGAGAGAGAAQRKSLSDEFDASPLSGKSSGMGYALQQKYWKAYKKAERNN